MRYLSSVRPVLCAAALLFVHGTCVAASLPDPLSLEQALALAGSEHPLMELAEAQQQSARAELLAAEALDSLRITAEGRARYVEPGSSAVIRNHDDHKASLFVRKELYDFGRSGALLAAAEARQSGAAIRYSDALTQHRLLVMERFFDVLLADLEFNRENEDMAVVYVSLDRLRDRHALGQVSDVELLKAEADYQEVRRRRTAAEGRQRLTRAALAQALNRPGQLPANLEIPDLELARKLPEVEHLYRAATERNPQLRILRAEREAAQRRVEAARAVGRPRLSGELEASAYSRDLPTNDQWRAGINLEVPLYTGGAVNAAVAQQLAWLKESEARLRQVELDLRQQILALWMEIQMLKVQGESAEAQLSYRELYLDRSRTVYELELTADLGDAMVRMTEAELAQSRTRYQLALALARLDALTGGPVAAEQEPTP